MHRPETRRWHDSLRGGHADDVHNIAKDAELDGGVGTSPYPYATLPLPSLRLSFPSNVCYEPNQVDYPSFVLNEDGGALSYALSGNVTNYNYIPCEITDSNVTIYYQDLVLGSAAVCL